jgi:hypothetical protein
MHDERCKGSHSRAIDEGEIKPPILDQLEVVPSESVHQNYTKPLKN